MALNNKISHHVPQLTKYSLLLFRNLLSRWKTCELVGVVRPVTYIVVCCLSRSCRRCYLKLWTWVLLMRRAWTVILQSTRASTMLAAIRATQWQKSRQLQARRKRSIRFLLLSLSSSRKFRYRWHDHNGAQLSAQPSTPVPHRSVPVCLQCHLQTTSSLCQPRSSRRASPSSQQLWSAGFFCGRTRDMELITRQLESSGHQQRLLQAFTEDVFIFSLRVYTAY